MVQPFDAFQKRFVLSTKSATKIVPRASSFSRQKTERVGEPSASGGLPADDSGPEAAWRGRPRLQPARDPLYEKGLHEVEDHPQCADNEPKLTHLLDLFLDFPSLSRRDHDLLGPQRDFGNDQARDHGAEEPRAAVVLDVFL